MRREVFTHHTVPYNYTGDFTLLILDPPRVRRPGRPGRVTDRDGVKVRIDWGGLVSVGSENPLVLEPSNNTLAQESEDQEIEKRKD